MPECLKRLRKLPAALALAMILYVGQGGVSHAAGVQFTSLGCETVDDMHRVTKLAATNKVDALQAVEDELIASGKCITIKKGTEVKLITSVRAHAPGTNILYSLAKIELLNRQVYIHRQNLDQ